MLFFEMATFKLKIAIQLIKWSDTFPHSNHDIQNKVPIFMSKIDENILLLLFLSFFIFGIIKFELFLANRLHLHFLQFHFGRRILTRDLFHLSKLLTSIHSFVTLLHNFLQFSNHLRVGIFVFLALCPLPFSSHSVEFFTGVLWHSWRS